MCQNSLIATGKGQPISGFKIMTGLEMTQIRKAMNLGRRAFAAQLGYRGSSETNFKAIMRFEMGRTEIPLETARKARALKEDFDAAKAANSAD